MFNIVEVRIQELSKAFNEISAELSVGLDNGYSLTAMDSITLERNLLLSRSVTEVLSEYMSTDWNYLDRQYLD